MEDERPVIVLTLTGYQCDMFISSENATRLIQQGEALLRNLRLYRSRLAESGEQIDLFQGTELPEDLLRLGFKSQR